MRCLKATWILFASALITFGATGVGAQGRWMDEDAGIVYMFDPDDKPVNLKWLWLPKSYREFDLELIRAAKTTLLLDRCEEIKEGTIDLKQGSREHPIYRILCRQPGGEPYYGRTYNEMIDGLTFDTLVTQEIPEEVLMQRKEPSLAATCFEDVLAKTSMMNELEWQSPKRPEALELNDAYAIYRWDFNAKNLDGDELRYKVICHVGSGGVASSKISVRRASD